MILQLIQRLEKSGELKQLINSGFLSTKILFHYEVFLEFDKTLKTQNKLVCDAVTETAEKFKLNESTVFRIIANFKQ